jgi:predicted amidohydrolase
MSRPAKVAACQLPEVREDPDAALLWIEEYAHLAADEGACLVCFPECYLQGYLTDEYAARRHAIDLNSAAFAAVLRQLAHIEPTLVFGMIEVDSDRLFNTAVVVEGGRLIGRYRKTHLLAGESMFHPGSACPVFDTAGLTFGINICSDTQIAEPATAVARQDAKLICCPANNMMRRDKAEKWKDRHNETRAQRARETGLWLISADVTGERDGCIALGPTAVIDPHGHIVAQVPLREIGMVVANIA